MNPWPETRQTLLLRLRDTSDQAAWNEFSQLYGPLIRRVAIRRGLQEADAADTSQRVLLSVARVISDIEWRPEGSFRAWLSRVTTNAALNLLERDGKHQGIGGDEIIALFDRVPAPSDELSSIWRLERQLQVFRQAAKKVSVSVSQENWSVFMRTTVAGEDIPTVANDTGKSIGSIYALRCRLMRSIREEVKRIESRETEVSPTGYLSGEDTLKK